MAQTQARQHRQKAASKAGAARMAPPPFDVGDISTFNGRNLEVAMRMGQAMFDGMATINQEFMRFMGERLQEDMRTARSFADCRHPSEFVDAELRFMQTCVQQYAENTNRMLGIAAEVMRNGMDDVEHVVTDIAKATEEAAR